MNNTKVYVGNLGFTMNERTLSDLFSKYGTVRTAKIVTDRETNKSRGFAFVEMSTQVQAEAAISKLNGAEIDGRRLSVSEAKPREQVFRDR